MAAAEAYGFDSVWPAEHHFSEYGYCASPAPWLAAHRKVLGSMDLMGTKVFPRLRHLEPPPLPQSA